MQNVSTLVFDWGNTLMKVFPEFKGPMVDWPHVEAIIGVKETLARLESNYRMVLATNASDSNVEQVRGALTRVELDGFFKDIFTFSQLQVRKPDQSFFLSIERLCGVSSQGIVMVGDDYVNDVLAAQDAGWRALWFNPDGKACPGLIPFYDGDVQNMGDLLYIIERPDIPDWDTCTRWMMKEGASSLLFMHVQAVAAVAYLLALWLRSVGEHIDPLLTHRGGILHDLSKLSAKTSEIDHAEMAGRRLEEFGQHELAEIARRHIIIEGRYPLTWEQKLVFFADKLVEGSAITGLDQRLEKLRQRYPAFRERIQNLAPMLVDLQSLICQKLQITPEILLERLHAASL